MTTRLLTVGWTGMGVLLWVMFPMTAAVLLPLCCIAPLAWYWGARQRLPWYSPSLATTGLAVACLYLLINASWSPSPASASQAVVLLIIMVMALHVVLSTLPDLEGSPLRTMAAGALVGVAAGGVILCIEIFSHQSLRRSLIGLVPALQPRALHLTMQGAQLAQLAPYLPNASICVLAAMLWPAALMAGKLGLWRAHRYAALIVFAVVVATVFASEHATSQVALVGAGATFALFRLRPKLAMPIVIAGWVAANLLVVPAAWLLYSAGAHRASWLPQSARERVVIWRYTADQIHEAPLLGAGVGAARAKHQARQGESRLAPGTQFPLSTNLHSHNAYLQIWYEAGAVGAALMLTLGLIALRGLRAFSAEVQAYLAATFVACALLAASAYSIWAPWFMASVAMTAVFAALGAALRPPHARSAADP